MNRKIATILPRMTPFLAAALLAACGGGGNNTLSPAHLMSAPGEAALDAYLKAPHQSTLTATDSSGNSYVLQTSMAPNPGTVTFDGHAGLLSLAASVSLSKNGVAIASSSATSYYTLSPYTAYGSTTSTGSPYAVASGNAPLPATVSVGGSGPINDLTYFHDHTKALIVGTAVETFSVSINTAVTLLLCLNTVTSGVTAQGTTDGLADGTESDCYAVDSAGNATLYSITVSVSGGTLTFK